MTDATRHSNLRRAFGLVVRLPAATTCTSAFAISAGCCDEGNPMTPGSNDILNRYQRTFPFCVLILLMFRGRLGPSHPSGPGPSGLRHPSGRNIGGLVGVNEKWVRQLFFDVFVPQIVCPFVFPQHASHVFDLMLSFCVCRFVFGNLCLVGSGDDGVAARDGVRM